MQANFPISSSTDHDRLPLSEPFEGTESVELDDIDTFAQEAFKDLIEENQKKDLPFYLALISDEKKTVRAYSAAPLFKYFKTNNDKLISPLTRQPIKQISIYKIGNLSKEIFQKIGNLSELSENHEHLAKMILASSEDIDKLNRGRNRFYAGLEAEKMGDIQLAKFWYKLAVKDENAEACSRMYMLLYNEFKTEKDENIYEQAIGYLQMADKLTPDSRSEKKTIRLELNKNINEHLSAFLPFKR